MAAVVGGVMGCAQVDRRPNTARLNRDVDQATYRPAEASDARQPMVLPSEPTGPSPPELTGPQPVAAYIHRALAENRTVQAAYHNVQSLRYRIPQVTALEDPVAANTIFPIPSVAPQYSLMGYNPYNLTLAQQFPWLGTRRLRGDVADRDVRVALAELAAAQRDAVAAVKRAYFDLHSAERAGAILAETRGILEDFHAIAKSRVPLGGSQEDVIRAETLISELDRARAENRQELASARAALARQIHASPESDLHTLPELPFAALPTEIERLYQLAVEARPEVRGRLEAIARDDKAVELARKRVYPNVTLGFTYMDMTRTDAVSRTASGSPNIGLFVGFNLPIYRRKYIAGVCEAQERALADTKLYEAQRDETEAEIKDFFTQARVQQDVLSLLRDGILPRARHALELAQSGYENQTVDIATVLSAQREVLQVEIQVAQVEAELGKALASLERAVGCQINERTLEPEPSTAPTEDRVEPLPLPPGASSPIRAAAPPTAGRGVDDPSDPS
jgi:outer membrane protein TolC